MVIDTITIEILERRINILEKDLAMLMANYYKTPLVQYEPIPYWLNPNFKLPSTT